MKQVKDLRQVLVDTWGYEDFRPAQKPIVESINSGQDGLAILSTGGGKSVCFQAPALAHEGTAIVVSPLISLMKDQVDALRDRGVKAGMVNSSLKPEIINAELETLRRGGFKIFYVAPERLISPEFVDLLKHVDVSFFAIDESHCISLWGHNFRLSYRGIAPVIRQIEEFQNRRIQRVALTATAKPETQRDIIESLEMENPFHLVGDFDRKNIEINVRKSVNKNRDLRDIIETHKEGSIIVYCATVNAVEALYDEFRSQGYRVGKYHGRMHTDEKNRQQDAFLADEVTIIFATNAFGMGVDKATVRAVVHYQLPGTLEAYFQEIGRAGRDGEKSASYLLWSDGDRNTQDFLVRTSVPEAHAVEGMKHTLKVYAGKGIVNESKSVIAGLAPDVIKEFDVDPIFRVLVDEGVIQTSENEEWPNYVGIDVIDADKELDLSYLSKSRKVMVDNLNAMERFARTEMCRRRILLRYFGEQLKEKNCGNCDVCLGMHVEQTKTSKLVAPEIVSSALSATKLFTGKLTLDRLGDFLLGVKITSWSRKGYDKMPNYGALKHWTKANVKSLLTKMTNEGLISEDPRKGNRIALTDRGAQALGSSEHVAIYAGPVNREDGVMSESGAQKAPEAFDKDALLQRQKILHEVRSSLADRDDIAPFMVFSEDVLKKLSKMAPANKMELQEAGLSVNKIEQYGDVILATLREMSPVASSPSPGREVESREVDVETPKTEDSEKIVDEIPAQEKNLVREPRPVVEEDDPGIPF